MRPCNFINVYITVEAVTLIGLTFVAATSFIIKSAMAKRKKSGTGSAPGTVKPPQAAPKAPAVVGTKVIDVAGNTAPAAPPVEIDNRPEKSPYASAPCTVPFASPMTVPLDILMKSPKLHSAFEGNLPELPAIPEDIGHVLVHYLHTGKYESLKPKEPLSPSKQLLELRTSIQAYAAARAYDLPDLMRLAEQQVEKYSEGLPLPSLLEVARDAHPTLSEGDAWFIDYLKARIRPHLEDPKSLLGTDILDRISNILSPNKVLLRTVLEMFCERIIPRAVQASANANAGSSKPSSPPPPAPTSPMSLLQIRSRAIVREDSSSKRKDTPWPSPDPELASLASLASLSKEPELSIESQEPAPVEVAELKPEPIPEPVKKGEQEPEPVPEPEPILSEPVFAAPVMVEPILPEPILSEPVLAKVAPQELSALPEPILSEPVLAKVAPSVLAALPEPILSEPVLAKPEPEAEPELQPEPELAPIAEVSAKEEEEELPTQEAAIVPAVEKPERKDSGKMIDLETLPEAQLVLKELDPIPEPETPSVEERPVKRVLREVDSGFWDFSPSDVEPVRSPAPSIVEIDPETLPDIKPAAAEVEAEAEPTKDLAVQPATENDDGISKKDFAAPEAEVDDDKPLALARDTLSVASDLEAAQHATPTDPEEAPAPMPEATFASASDDQQLEKALSEAVAEELKAPEPEQTKVELSDETPETTTTDKVEPSTSQPAATQSKLTADQAAGAESATHTEPDEDKTTVQPESDAAPAPAAAAHDDEPLPLPDHDVAAGPADTTPVEPRVEPQPEPAGEPQDVAKDVAQGVAIPDPTATTVTTVEEDKPADAAPHADTIADAVTDAAPASPDAAVQVDVPSAQPEPAPATDATTTATKESQPAAAVQSGACAAQERQRSWKRRFLRYPVLFGRGM